jgi:hypothetical protein
MPWKFSGEKKIEQSRNNLAPGQITRRAEEDEYGSG